MRNCWSWIFFPLNSADHIDQYINVNSFKFYKSNLKVDSVFSLFTISNNVSTLVSYFFLYHSNFYLLIYYIVNYAFANLHINALSAHFII